MRPDTIEKINQAVVEGKNARTKAMELIKAGKSVADREVSTLIDKADAKANEVERLKAQDRDTEYAAHRFDEPQAPEAVGEFADGSILRSGQGFRELDAYVRGRAPSEYQTLRVGADGSGGYAVPPALTREVLLDPQSQSALRKAGASVRECATDEYEEILLTGDIVAPAAEVASSSESTNPTITMWSRRLTKFRTLQFISEQQRDDQHVDITGGLVSHIVDQLRVSEDVYLSNGDGIGLNPRGFLRDTGITRFDIEGTTGTTVSNTTADGGSAQKIVQMMGQLPSRFHDGAVFMCHGSTLAAIRALVDAEGRPYFPETYTGDVLIGKPVILNDGFPVGGTANQPVLAFGNFRRGFRLVDKAAGMSIRVLNERYADADLIGIRGIYRVGGGVILPQAFVIGVADASPFGL